LGGWGGGYLESDFGLRFSGYMAKKLSRISRIE
jgi:hypothetical protein